MKKDKPEKMNP